MRRLVVCLAAILGIAFSISAQYGRGYSAFWMNANSGEEIPASWRYPNESGTLGIVQAEGDTNTSGHPFFTALGSNGRACVTCHQPFWGMSVSAASIRDRWYATAGTDPIFAAFDGANCPGLPQHMAQSHSLAMERGLFRIPLAWPPRDENGKPQPVEFTIELVRDPTGCNNSPNYGLYSANPTISVFRRPRPASNLKYVTAGEGNLMADGREPSLASQARSAVLGHQQGEAPSDAVLKRIVTYESQVYAAQVFTKDARGFGPEALLHGVEPDFMHLTPSAARGADLFVHREFKMDGIAHSESVKLDKSGKATCATCHTTPFTGQAESKGWVDVGTTNRPTWNEPETWEQTGDLPVFKITCAPTAAPHPALGREIYTTDPGRALISGKCADVGSIVMQQLRGLAARPPYFVNGSAETLRDVVDYYDRRFEMKLSEAEKVDLVRFLEAL